MNNFNNFGSYKRIYPKRKEDNDLEIKAIYAIKDKIEESYNEFKQGKIKYTPAAFVGGYDIETGYVCADYSRTIIKKENLHEQLRKLIDNKVEAGKINKYGEYGKYTPEYGKEKPKIKVGRCAEVHVVDKILNFNENFFHNSNDINNSRLTFAIRIKDKEKKFENRIKKESTEVDVLNSWMKILINDGYEYLPYCLNCLAMFRGTSILKERFL